MKDIFSKFFPSHIDWLLFLSTLPLLGAGLVTMSSFVDDNYLAQKQLIWILISFVVFFTFCRIDWHFLNRSGVLIFLFLISCLVLVSLFLVSRVRGVQGWFKLGLFSLQPVDFVKVIIVLILSKYFSRRHIEIANVKHILISGIYAVIPFILVLLQPDFGLAIIIFLIWLGMIMVSGVSKKHLFLVFITGALSFFLLWSFVLLPYQKNRIISFLNPTADIQGTGYNSFQSQIAVGSGRLFGKGVGFGTQSRLKFLPEYQTDFVFAAFAEEWGFVGVFWLFLFFTIIIYRILANSFTAASNFETLFGIGLAILFSSHFIINIGMNIGLLPVTGITLPFISYGGSHLVAEFGGLGILVGMRKRGRAVHRDDVRNEFLGLEA